MIKVENLTKRYAGQTAIQAADCSWRTSWNASPGATSYQVKPNTGSIKTTTSTTLQYNCPTGQLQAYRPLYVQACNTGGCSAKVNF